MPLMNTVFSGAMPEFGHQLLHGLHDAVVAATGAPPHLLVAHPVLLGGERDDGVAHCNASFDGVFEFGGREGQTLHLGDRLGVDQVVGTHDAAQLAEVELGHEDSRGYRCSSSPRLGGIGLTWVRWIQATFVPAATGALHGGVDGRPCGTPAEHADVGVVRRRRRRRAGCRWRCRRSSRRAGAPSASGSRARS